MARTMMDTNPSLEKYIHGHIEPVIRRFDAALMQAMPELTPEDVFWRMHLLVGRAAPVVAHAGSKAAGGAADAAAGCRNLFAAVCGFCGGGVPRATTEGLTQ